MPEISAQNLSELRIKTDIDREVRKSRRLDDWENAKNPKERELAKLKRKEQREIQAD